MNLSLPSFPYTAMTVTGILHIVLGLIVFINGCIGLGMANAIIVYDQQQQIIVDAVKMYLGLIIGSTLWILMVGVLGVLTGLKTDNYPRTQGFKIAYMVTSVLLALLFNWVGFVLPFLFIEDFPGTAVVGCLGGFFDFVLSIITSFICCFCADISANSLDVLLAQQEITPPVPPPGSSTAVYYPPGTYPRKSYPPGTVPPHYYIPDQAPAGNDPATNDSVGTVPPHYYIPAQAPAGNDPATNDPAGTNPPQYSPPVQESNPPNDSTNNEVP